MEFVRSCIFPHQPLWRSTRRVDAPPFDEHVCNCAVMDKVNEAMQTYFKKGTALNMTKEELEFLPYEVLKRSAKQEIHLVWDKLSEHAQKHLEDHKICEKHPFNGNSDQIDGPRTLIVDCWYCRAEKERKEETANDDAFKF